MTSAAARLWGKLRPLLVGGALLGTETETDAVCGRTCGMEQPWDPFECQGKALVNFKKRALQDLDGPEIEARRLRNRQTTEVTLKIMEQWRANAERQAKPLQHKYD